MRRKVSIYPFFFEFLLASISAYQIISSNRRKEVNLFPLYPTTNETEDTSVFRRREEEKRREEKEKRERNE
jgi:hypothetical protein